MKDYNMKKPTVDPDRRIRWAAYITTKDGRKIYARALGLRAFPIRDTRPEKED
jgi:hypothetical protein